MIFGICLAGAVGIEPTQEDLESPVLPLYDAPSPAFRAENPKFEAGAKLSKGNSKQPTSPLRLRSGQTLPSLRRNVGEKGHACVISFPCAGCAWCNACSVF